MKISSYFPLEVLHFQSLCLFIYLFLLILMFCIIYSMGSVSLFCMWISSFLQTIVEETIFTLLYSLVSLIKIQLTVYVWNYFQPLYSIPLAHMYVFMPVSNLGRFLFQKCVFASLDLYESNFLKSGISILLYP